MGIAATRRCRDAWRGVFSPCRSRVGMGIGVSTAHRRRLEDTHGGSSSAQASQTIQDRLQQLPQLTAALQLNADPVWADLRRLQSVLDDPEQKQLKQEIQTVWETLHKWAQQSAGSVHKQQLEIHTLLEEIAHLTQRLKQQEQEERNACEKLKHDLAEVHKLTDMAQSFERQLRRFNERLHRL